MPLLGVRETSTQLRWPRQRNWWVETADGKRVNSSSLGPPRAIAPYLLVMDLSFSAYFSFLAGKIRREINHEEGAFDSSVLPAFFCLLAPVVWQWNQVNLLLNMFDPEDISTELLVVALSTAVIGLADCTPRCMFIGADTGEHGSDPGDADCTSFAVVFMMLKLVTAVYACYYAWQARGARILAARSVLGTACVGAACAALLALPSESGSGEGEEMDEFRAVYFGLTAFAIELGTSFAPLPCSLCSKLGLHSLTLSMPLDLSYSEKRWERLFFVTLGTVVARAVTTLDGECGQLRFTHRIERCVSEGPSAYFVHLCSHPFALAIYNFELLCALRTAYAHPEARL